MRIALYQPEIAGNTGAVLRIAACFGIAVDVVEPTGFVWSDAKMRRAGMYYADKVSLTRHGDWAALRDGRDGRLMLMTTKGRAALGETRFEDTDILVFGSESAGVPDAVAQDCDKRVRIPIANGTRSLNLSVACGIALYEALRQTGGLPQ